MKDTIKLPKQLFDSITVLVEETKLFEDEADFINQAIIEQIRKFKK